MPAGPFSTGSDPTGSDSAGVPWAGRDLRPNPFAGDTGESDPELVELMRAAVGSTSADRHRAVVEALAPARLFVPIVAAPGETETTDDGLEADKSADMAMVTVAAPDGRRTVPAFTSVALLAAWSSEARPVPVESVRLMLSAVSEDAQLVIIDPGTDYAFLVRRPAVWALAQGKPWTPSWADPDVADALDRAAAGIPAITEIACLPGTDTEARLELTMVPGLGRDELTDVLTRFQNALTQSTVIAEGIDSLAITVQ
ncbi:SseB family protein [Spelaeicoccus albus]|uniref:SseB protein N-terminal domain-containing protein n=1 Tax=Spelaeicoccus albus TaxID=1280376 RepID=A0A7Z0IHV2_9MICO|nr:SseB family protein [Spelaeicoccus albus]NYI67837.1 hypothetical protein [Spelaeicoccus albus]